MFIHIGITVGKQFNNLWIIHLHYFHNFPMWISPDLLKVFQPLLHSLSTDFIHTLWKNMLRLQYRMVYMLKVVFICIKDLNFEAHDRDF